MNGQQQARLKKGLLIVFEGIDGAGKTTQARLVYNQLRQKGFDCLLLREPTDGPYGRQIKQLAVTGRDSISAEEEFRLFLNDREQDVRENIRPALKRRAIVIIDRYYHSSMAYQGAKGLSPALIRRENEKIAPRPDLVLYIDIPPQMGIDRIEKIRNQKFTLFEKEAELKRVKAIFDAINTPEVVRIDGTKDVDQIHQDVMRHIVQLVKTCQE